MSDLRRLIREVPDFPKPGILFYDITTLLKDPEGFAALTEQLVSHCGAFRPDTIVGIEARGFIFGPLLAARLGVGFIPVRKPGKLPAETDEITYDLEYRQDTLQIHRDAIRPDQRVLVVDDLLATGGTAAATCRLVENCGGKVAGLVFVVELTFLEGRKKLAAYDIVSLVQYDQ